MDKYLLRLNSWTTTIIKGILDGKTGKKLPRTQYMNHNTMVFTEIKGCIIELKREISDIQK